jgi:hypothetical protein
MSQRSAQVRASKAKVVLTPAQIEARRERKREIQRQWYLRHRDEQQARDAVRRLQMTDEVRAKRAADQAKRRRAGRIDRVGA